MNHIVFIVLLTLPLFVVFKHLKTIKNLLKNKVENKSKLKGLRADISKIDYEIFHLHSKLSNEKIFKKLGDTLIQKVKVEEREKYGSLQFRGPFLPPYPYDS